MTLSAKRRGGYLVMRATAFLLRDNPSAEDRAALRAATELPDGRPVFEALRRTARAAADADAGAGEETRRALKAALDEATAALAAGNRPEIARRRHWWERGQMA